LLACAIGLLPLAMAAPSWAAATPESFAGLIDQVTPAVVQITTTQKAPRDVPGANPLDQLPEQFREGPLRDFFDRFFQEGAPGLGVPPPAPRNALGSGFIIDPGGIVVTNNHVIGQATDIKVKLKDGRELTASLVGSDEKTDLAVLRISPDKPLPAVAWGDSDAARVGDWVIAIGNPFGLGGTVTAGIISSRGRDLGAGPYDDFIQIDAPINSGNSGGPLFNSEGKVIGVNTAILSPSGGSIGIGFAIPSELARKVVAELQQKGSVDRGWLGVAIQPVTQEVADSLGLKEAKGALVASVTADSPAAKAGLRQGDVITSFDGRPVAVVRDLTRAVADAPIGDRKTVDVWRGDRQVSIKVQIGQMPKQMAQNEEPGPGGAAPAEGTALTALGLTVMPLDEAARARFGLDATANGVVVATVARDHDAASKGIRPGDIIVRANDKTVESIADLQSVVNQARTSGRKAVLLLVQREGETRFIAVQLSST
jgi:serine protease Do